MVVEKILSSKVTVQPIAAALLNAAGVGETLATVALVAGSGVAEVLVRLALRWYCKCLLLSVKATVRKSGKRWRLQETTCFPLCLLLFADKNLY